MLMLLRCQKLESENLHNVQISLVLRVCEECFSVRLSVCVCVCTAE